MNFINFGKEVVTFFLKKLKKWFDWDNRHLYKTQNPKIGIAFIDLSLIRTGWLGFFIYIYIYIIGLVGRVFINGLGDYGSIQGEVIPKIKKKKWFLIPPCLTLSMIRYISRVKWSNPGKGVAPSPTLRCSSNWTEILQVALDYGHQFYFLHYIRNAIEITAFLSVKNQPKWSLYYILNLIWIPSLYSCRCYQYFSWSC